METKKARAEHTKAEVELAKVNAQVETEKARAEQTKAEVKLANVTLENTKLQIQLESVKSRKRTVEQAHSTPSKQSKPSKPSKQSKRSKFLDKPVIRRSVPNMIKPYTPKFSRFDKKAVLESSDIETANDSIMQCDTMDENHEPQIHEFEEKAKVELANVTLENTKLQIQLENVKSRKRTVEQAHTAPSKPSKQSKRSKFLDKPVIRYSEPNMIKPYTPKFSRFDKKAVLESSDTETANDSILQCGTMDENHEPQIHEFEQVCSYYLKGDTYADKMFSFKHERFLYWFTSGPTISDKRTYTAKHAFRAARDRRRQQMQGTQ